MDELEKIIELMNKNRLEVVEYKGIKVVKTNHYSDPDLFTEIPMTEVDEPQSERDLLFAHEGVE